MSLCFRQKNGRKLRSGPNRKSYPKEARGKHSAWRQGICARPQPPGKIDPQVAAASPLPLQPGCKRQRPIQPPRGGGGGFGLPNRPQGPEKPQPKRHVPPRVLSAPRGAGGASLPPPGAGGRLFTRRAGRLRRGSPGVRPAGRSPSLGLRGGPGGPQLPPPRHLPPAWERSWRASQVPARREAQGTPPRHPGSRAFETAGALFSFF